VNEFWVREPLGHLIVSDEDMSNLNPRFSLPLAYFSNHARDQCRFEPCIPTRGTGSTISSRTASDTSAIGRPDKLGRHKRRGF
jgi:hypothetical protein